MLKDLTRPRLIRVWFTAVFLVIVAAIAFGASLEVRTMAIVSVVALIPPALVLMLWPGARPPTAAEVIHGADR